MKTNKRLRSFAIILFVIYVPYNLIAQNWIPVYRFSNGTSNAFEHLYTTNRTEVTTWTSEDTAFYISDSFFTGSVPVYRLKKDGTPRLRLLTSNETEKSNAISAGYILEKTLGYIYPSDSQIGNIIYRVFKASVGDRFYTTSQTEYNTTINNGYKAESNLGRTFSEKPSLEINTNEIIASSTSGSNSISVAANTSWSVSSNQSWLTITSDLNGNNNGSVSFNYSANESINARSATITITIVGLNSKTITVTQQGKSLSLLITPSGEKSATAQSGTGSINVVSNVSWTANSNQNWLTISSGTTGNNNSTVSYNYLANETTVSRTALITISGNGVNPQTLSIIQGGKTANLTISPSGSSTINSISSSGSISVTSNVDWSASSNQSWLTITSGSNGKNDGVISYTYSTNSNSTSRSATITVTGNGATTQTLTFNQSGQEPEITFNPTSPINASSTAGEARVLISSNANWEAATTDNWLTIFPSAGVANTPIYSTIYYSENNTNASRTGYITFAINGVAKTTIEVIQKTANQISISLDATGVSHLFWPFYNKNTSLKNPISSYEKMNGWRIAEGSAAHTGKELYAQDWNFNYGTPDCNLDFYSPLSGKVILVNDTFSPVCEQNPDIMPKKSYGNYVVIRSDVNESYRFLIGHLNTVDVSLNSYINIGTKIGTIGSTGSSETSHAHVSLFYNNSVPAKFNFDATDSETGGGLGQPTFNSNCYGFTKSGSFYIAKNMIEEVEGVVAKICYWDYKNSVWLEKDMIIEGDFYVFHSNDIYNEYRDYCIHVYTNEGETWLPSAIRDYITTKNDFKANPANDGYNFYTKPAMNVPLVACAEETSIENVSPIKYKLYPNPTKDILNISFTDSNDSYAVQIFDITGSVVYSNYKIGNSTININGLKSGLYIVKIQVDKKLFYEKLIIEK